MKKYRNLSKKQQKIVVKIINKNKYSEHRWISYDFFYPNKSIKKEKKSSFVSGFEITAANVVSLPVPAVVGIAISIGSFFPIFK